jgi:hypothetical protein
MIGVRRGDNVFLRGYGAGTDLVAGVGHYYVDKVNGSNTGDGSPGNPWKDLSYAATQIAAPTDFAEFNTDVVFHLAPGDYGNAITMPHRRRIFIAGGPATISGDILWPYDRQYWFAEDPTQNIGALLIKPDQVQGFTLSGKINAQNVAPANGTAFFRRLGISNSILNCDILNRKSGSAVDGQQTGELVTFLLDCEANFTGSSKYIGGEREDAMPSEYNNALVLYTDNAYLLQDFGGCVAFNYCMNTQFQGAIDWQTNPVTGGGSYAGAIGGAVHGFMLCTFNTAPVFGWDNATGSAPGNVRADAYSYSQFPGWTVNNISIDRMVEAIGVGAVDSQMIGPLRGRDDVQECLERLDEGGVVWAGETTNDTETEIYWDGQASKRFTVDADTIRHFDLRITAIDEARNFRTWKAHGAILRDNAGNTTIPKPVVYLSLQQSHPDKYSSTAANTIGNGTLVVKEDIGGAPSSGVVQIDGDQYTYSAKIGDHTFDLDGTLTATYAEDDYVAAGTRMWEASVRADDSLEALVVKVKGQIGTDAIKWRAVGFVDELEVPTSE